MTDTNQNDQILGNTFLRAAVGFTALTMGIASMSYVALWALDRFAGGIWWASLLVVAIALVAECLTYADTLAEPVRDWIKEPKRRRENAEHRAEHDRRMAEMAARK